MGWLSNRFRRAPRPEPREQWEKLRPRVEHLAEPAIHLAASSEPTSCWFGGAPRVDTAAFEWPEVSGRPLAFWGQLDLAELHAAHGIDWLPERGSLAFFYDVEEMPWGFDPKDRGKWTVLHFDTTTGEPPLPPVAEGALALDRVFLRPSKVDVLPDTQNDAAEALELTDAEWDAYADFRRGVDPDEPAHQVGGFASPVQGDMMELECQLASNGVYVGDASGYESSEGRRLESGARDWRLLLQFDSDDDVGVMWGDCGMLYFWVREQDARAGRFDDVWLVLQCS